MASTTPPDDTCTGAELARLLRISPQALRGHARRGHVVRIAPGVYRREASIQGYAVHLQAVAAARQSQDADLVKERALLAREQREGHRLRNEETRRNLVSVDEVRGRWRLLSAKMRAGMLAVTGRVREAIPELTDTEIATLERELRTALVPLDQADAEAAADPPDGE